MALKVDIRVPVGLPVNETADFIAKCEDAGFSGVGLRLCANHLAKRYSRTLRAAPLSAALTAISLTGSCQKKS